MNDRTPVMSDHARERCAEMGISTKVAKKIWRTAHTIYPGNVPGSLIALSREHPDYRVVFTENDGRVVIITVAFECRDFEYVRDGATFRPKEGDPCPTTTSRA